MRLILETDIRYLALVLEFRAKVQRAFENQQGESFRVLWRPVGWIVFVLDAHGNYIGYAEKSLPCMSKGAFVHG
jgi:hypothetical protein